MQLELPIAADNPAGVRVARQATTEVITCWDVRAGVADDACLVVSELVTNALLHGRSDTVLQLLRDGDRLRVQVLDQDTRLPVPVAPDPQSLTGRGLAIVASLAALWGTERTAAGKLVWAEFDLADRRSH